MRNKKKNQLFDLPEVYHKSHAKSAVKISAFVLLFLFGFSLWATDSLNFHLRPMISNEPKMLRVFSPSTVQKGTSVEFTVECWDYCERLACDYSGSVHLSSMRENPNSPDKLISADANFPITRYDFIPSGMAQGFVEAYRIPWGDGGMKKMSVTFNEPGIHYIIAKDEELGIIAYSNPIMVFEGKPEYNLFWGDIHGHTSKCDGSGYLDQVLYYAKNVACLDFCSITTHDQFINALVAPLGWQVNWEHTKWVVNEWNKKDNFVTLQAHEWRGNFVKTGDPRGDRIIYSRSSELPFFSGADERYNDDDKLHAALKDWMAEKEERKVMTIHHHPPHTLMGLRTDWSYYDPELTRLVEIYSVHGSSEMHRAQGNEVPLIGGTKEPTIMEIDKPGYHIRDALAMGYHIGIMASGDSHDGHIGHSISHTEARHLWQPPLSWGAFPNHMFRCHHWQQNGMIGVFSSNLTRETIFDAMWNRACYATKGTSRPLVDFKINGNRPGDSESIITLSEANQERTIEITAAAGGGDGNFLRKIEIIRNNEVWKSYDYEDKFQRIAHITLSDNDPIQGINYWEYANINATDEPYFKNGTYYINEDADIGKENPEEYSTNGETFYYVKVYTDGSDYYDEMYNYYTFSGQNTIPRGDDVAWVGPIWVKNP